jgi:hypothetical protein
LAAELKYDNIKIGSEIPGLIKRPTTRQMVKWAGAAEEYFEIHYDKDFALGQGLPGVLVAAGMLWAYLGEMLTDWVGERGTVKKISCSFRGMHVPNEDVICKGKVTGKNVSGDQPCLECEIWTENIRGEKTTLGTAIIALPV